MTKGKIKWFSPVVGGGFIRTDDGHDVFFKIDAKYSGKPEILERGQWVCFDIIENSNGLSRMALNLRRFE